MIVHLDDRKFLVEHDDQGIKTIREEKVYAPGRPWESLYRVLRWSRTSRSRALTNRGHLFKRIEREMRDLLQSPPRAGASRSRHA